MSVVCRVRKATNSFGPLMKARAVPTRPRCQGRWTPEKILVKGRSVSIGGTGAGGGAGGGGARQKKRGRSRSRSEGRRSEGAVARRRQGVQRVVNVQKRKREQEEAAGRKVQAALSPVLSPSRGDSSISDSTQDSSAEETPGEKRCRREEAAARSAPPPPPGSSTGKENYRGSNCTVSSALETVQETEDEAQDQEREQGKEKKTAAPSSSAVALAHFTAKGYAASMSKSAVQRWVQYLFKFRDFVKEHGHGGVPLKFDTPKYEKLGAWVASQRQAMRNLIRVRKGLAPTSCHSLTEKQHICLHRVGFSFRGRASATEFYTQLQRLKHFRSKYPTAAIPADFDTEEYPKLGAWIARQRAGFRTMSQERRTKLLKAGIDG